LPVIVFIVLLLAGCTQLVPAPQAELPPDPQAAWGRVLERFVDDAGRVDFAALAQDRADLDRFVAWIYAEGPQNAPQRFPSREHVLAYHLNAYNALAMYNVLERGIPASLAGLEKVDFFALRKLKVAAVPLSLYAYENDVIRPLGEERVHFALNCMVRGCPRLPRTPFRAEDLERQLAAETRHFLAEPRNVRLDPARRVVHLSEILRFYSEDFLAKAPSLPAYVNRHRGEKIPEDYEVAFIPYDWTVNRQR
jgi:hypothetical protein